MILTCKTCSSKFNTVKDFVKHFELSHKTSSLSRFCCGLDSCFILSSNQGSYEKHMLEFHPLHQEGDKVSPTCRIYRCTFPDCFYSCSVSSTLRSHRKPKHGSVDLLESEENSVPKVALLNCDVNIDQGTHDHDLPSSVHVPSEWSAVGPPVSLDERRNQIKQKFSHFYLTLTSKYHIPESTIQFMIDTHRDLGRGCEAILTEELTDKLVKCVMDDPEDIVKLKDTVSTVVANNVASEVHNPQGNMRSMYMHRKNYHADQKFVSPTSFKLGLNDCNEKRVGHFINIEKSLIQLFEDDSIFEQYMESKFDTSSEDMIRDIYDGSLIQKHPILSHDRSAIGIMMYQDDLEIANAIGAAKGRHKITGVYCTLSNLKPWTRTKIKVIRLALIVAEKDVAYFGLRKAIKPLLKQLKSLEDGGITIRGQPVRVVPLMLLGDNLGTHTFIGLLENFSKSKFFCRHCEEPREDWQKRWLGVGDEELSDSEDESSDSACDSDDEISDHESADGNRVQDVDQDQGYDDWDEEDEEPQDMHLLRHVPFNNAPMRTPSSYDDCLEQLEKRPSSESFKGVVAKCPLNELKSFHCIGSAPPCIAHDLFEGVVAYDVALAIKYFLSTTSITVDFINRKIRSLKMLGSDQGDKPAPVTEKMKKLRRNAVQNWNFLRFLPVIFGCRIRDIRKKIGNSTKI